MDDGVTQLSVSTLEYKGVRYRYARLCNRLKQVSISRFRVLLRPEHFMPY